MKDTTAQKAARILMVDDNGLGLVARKTVLEELGHRITVASTAMDALELFHTQSFDIVITDFKMPAMNGVELIARLREIRDDIATILISGFTDALGLNEATTGANAVIQKSAQEVPQLIKAVGKLTRTPPKKPAGRQGRVKNRGARAAGV